MDPKLEGLRHIAEERLQGSETPKPVFAPNGTVEVIDYTQVNTLPPIVNTEKSTPTKPLDKIKHFLKKYPFVLPISVVVLLSIIGGVIWMLVTATPPIKNTNVTVSVSAPADIPIGSTREWKVTIKNDNPVQILNTTAVLQLDQNFRYGRNTSTDTSITFDQRSTTYFLGKMDAGSTRIISFDGQVLGAIQETSTLQAKVIFTPQTTTGVETFEVLSEKYTTTIITSDIKAEISKVQELVEVNTDTSITFKFENISDKDIINLRLRGVYPSSGDFIYRSSRLDQGTIGIKTTPSEGVNTWLIDTLPKKSVFTLTVNGTIAPNAKTEIPFTFEIASLSADKEWKKILEKTDTLRSTPQSLAISTYINGIKEFFKPSDVLEVVVEYENKSTKSITGIEISSTINDPANLLDYSKLKVITGTPSISNKTIIWKAGSFSDLASLQPGTKGALRYQIPVKTQELALSSSTAQDQYTLQTIAEVKQVDKQSLVATSQVLYKMAGGMNFAQKAVEIKDKTQTVFASDTGDFKVVRISLEITTLQNQLKTLSYDTSSNLTSLFEPVFNPLSVSPADFVDKVLFSDAGGSGALTIKYTQGVVDNYLGISKSKQIVTFDLKVPASLTPNPSSPVYTGVTVLNKSTLTAIDAISGEIYKFEIPAFNFGALVK